MSSSAQESHLPIFPTSWRVGVKSPNFFAKNCIKYPDLHREIIFDYLHPHGDRDQFPKTMFFPLNEVKC